MQTRVARILGIAITSLFCFSLNAQENGDLSSKIRHNSLSIYAGLFDEFNINYERNIFQRPQSYTNIRLGFGNASFITAGDGLYINPSLVHLIGKKNSHLELDIGIKYIVNYPDPKPSLVLVPDLFAGYRFEKPSGGIILRIGLNYPTIINLGIGIKF
jgi:hypothetical protein